MLHVQFSIGLRPGPEPLKYAPDRGENASAARRRPAASSAARTWLGRSSRAPSIVVDVSTPSFPAAATCSITCSDDGSGCPCSSGACHVYVWNPTGQRGVAAISYPRGRGKLRMKRTTDAVERYLDRLIADGTELGIQIAAYVDGKLALDTWAGLADDATGRLVDGETLFTLYSATKGIVATAIHMLVERGKLSYEARIAECWPEFAANAKGSITLRHALSHQAGIPKLPPGVTRLSMTNWDETCAAIANATPELPAGTRTEYHGATIGHIVGECLRRVDGRSVRQFVHDDIGHPLGVADLNLGVPPEKEARVARLRDAKQPPVPMAPTPAPSATGTGQSSGRRFCRRPADW
jgi:CubicO group peptidase (beta-lactamase class C family)